MTPTKLVSAVVNAANMALAASIAAGGVFTPPIQMDRGQTSAISIAGTTFTNTTKVTVQRRYNAAQDWRDVMQYEASAELGFYAETGMEVRVGVKTADYTAADIITLDMKTG